MEEKGIVASDCGQRLSSDWAPLPAPRHHHLGSGAPAGDNLGQQSLSPPCRSSNVELRESANGNNHFSFMLLFTLECRE
ncbi:unnamed protein product [Boreogadus saida]